MRKVEATALPKINSKSGEKILRKWQCLSKPIKFCTGVENL